MRLRPELRRVVASVRDVMKHRGIHYRDVAKALSVSLPTVKRLFSAESVDIERLLDVADWLGIDFYQLVEMSRAVASDELRFTKKQEDFFATSPAHLAFYMALPLGVVSVDELIKRLSLTKRSVSRYLQKLEALALLTRSQAGELMNPRRGSHYCWDDRGSIGQVYSRHFIAAMSARAKQSLSDESPSLRMMMGSRRLTSAEFAELGRELGELVDKFRTRSVLNAAALRSDARRKDAAHEISYLFIADRWRDDFFDRVPELT